MLEQLKHDRDLCNFNPSTGESEPISEDCRKSAEALDMAIKLIEQQPRDDCEYNRGYRDGYDKGNLNGYELRKAEEKKSDDSVSRTEVIDELNRLGRNAFKDDTDYDNFFAFVDNLPSVTPTQNWIPVSERLPEDRNIVLVTAYWHEAYQVMMASYFGDGLWWCVPFNNCGDHMQKLNPKAWQPLPKPYEEKRGTENGSN